MKRTVTLLCLLSALGSSYAADYVESFGVVSDNYVGYTKDIQLIRRINGGTVIIPEFDSSCPEEIKGPFAYACKIVEEYMPTCMPLRVQVSCEPLDDFSFGSSSITVSNVRTYTPNPDDYDDCAKENMPLCKLKGLIVGEMGYNEYQSHFDLIPDIAFLTENPDITITYNSQMLAHMSFSLELTGNDKFDFVSLVIRDLLRGLGISSNFIYNPYTKELNRPTFMMTAFEKTIDNALGSNIDSKTRLTNATKGSLKLSYNASKSLTLYAPNVWTPGMSLNYFIPQDDCDVSQSLSYNFGRGTVSRSLSDGYNDFIFRDLLGWKPNILVSTGGQGYKASGSTSLCMPYNGAININFEANTSNANNDAPVMLKAPLSSSKSSSTVDPDLKEYIAVR